MDIANKKDIIVVRWISEQLKSGLHDITNMYTAQAELVASIESLVFIISILLCILFTMTVFESLYPLWEQQYRARIEAYINQTTNTHWQRNIDNYMKAYKHKNAIEIEKYKREALIRFPQPIKPFSFKNLRVEYDFAKPYGLKGIFAQIANIINLTRMAKRGYLKSITAFLITRLLLQVQLYISQSTQIMLKKDELFQSLLKPFNTVIVSGKDPTVVQFAVNKFGEHTTQQGFTAATNISNQKSQDYSNIFPSPGDSPSQTILKTTPEQLQQIEALPESTQESLGVFKRLLSNVVQASERVISEPRILNDKIVAKQVTEQIVESVKQINDKVDIINFISP